MGIDLGTTNIKVMLYDENLKVKAESNSPVTYIRDGDMVEFDADAYFEDIVKVIHESCKKVFKQAPYPLTQIVLTGQAESLVVLGQDGRPLRNVISWMDMRSSRECEELKRAFDAEECYRITGQPEIIPTWPVTKILWLKHNEPETFSKAGKYLLLKDYIIYRMCGELKGDYSIYNFSHYFNIVEKTYWTEILDYVGVKRAQLPDTVPSCTVVGKASAEFAEKTGVCSDTAINCGTLDHFAGMIGVGNIHEGTISESTGTVLALATLLKKPFFSEEKVALHCGPFEGTYVFLPCCESGGSSLEWFKRACMPNTDYGEINAVLKDRKKPGEVLFIPYITGANAPDNNMKASGVFFGCRAKHDAFDMAQGIMEGVAHMLNKNIIAIAETGLKVEKIISTGGGAKSEIWNQMKADITGKEVNIPRDKEAACLGAAMIGAVSEGRFKDFDEAAEFCVSMDKVFKPMRYDEYRGRVKLYDTIFGGMQDAYCLQPATES